MNRIGNFIEYKQHYPRDDEFFDKSQYKCECGSTSFNILLLGTPSTPPDIQSVNFRCTECGKHSQVVVIYNVVSAGLKAVLNAQGIR
jgi:hypothetical protein